MWFVVAALEKENEALRLKVQELERKAMRQEVKFKSGRARQRSSAYRLFYVDRLE